MKRLSVYDIRNTSRLLGSVMMPEHLAERQGEVIYKALPIEPMEIYSYEGCPRYMDEVKVKMDRVIFHIDWKLTDPYTKGMVLLTPTKLDNLMKLRDFWLPGETLRQMAHRQRMASYYA